MTLIRLIALLSILGAIDAFAAVECEKKGRYWYPKNETAKTIASSLGVKTCNGRRFKEVVKQLGETSNVKVASKSMSVEDVVKAMKK